MSSHFSFEPLRGAEGQPTPVIRYGNTILRPAAPWSHPVHALLRHLERVGFAGCPRLVGDGFDDHGRQVLTYIEGAFVHPHAWNDEGIWRVGRMLRELHDATADFRPPADAVWPPWPFRSFGPDAVISHCDAGPWHVVVRHGKPIGFIDWESAGPINRLDEVAATGWWNAQLHDDDVAEQHNLPTAAARAAQLRYFLDGYGFPIADRRGFVTRMIDYAVRDCAAEAAKAGITPETSDPAPLWALAWRARAAGWMLRHCSMLEHAIQA